MTSNEALDIIVAAVERFGYTTATTEALADVLSLPKDSRQ